MKKHYECQPAVWHEKPLIFDWDEETGEVDGPGADTIKERAAWAEVSAHPYGNAWELSKTPLKSKTDMAAIIGYSWILPDDLAKFYPQFDEDYSDLPPDAIIG